jgi:hypothetical protein
MSAPFISTDDVGVLSRLIDHATRAVGMRPNHEQAILTANFDLVCAACQRPSEGNRAIGDHTVMFATAVKLCDKALHRYDDREAAIYARVIGTMFPDIRADLGRAMENRRRPTA